MEKVKKRDEQEEFPCLFLFLVSPSILTEMYFSSLEHPSLLPLHFFLSLLFSTPSIPTPLLFYHYFFLSRLQYEKGGKTI